MELAMSQAENGCNPAHPRNPDCTLHRQVVDLEDEVRQVKSYACLLFNRLTDRTAIDHDMHEALCLVAIQLVDAADGVNERYDDLFETVIPRHV